MVKQIEIFDIQPDIDFIEANRDQFIEPAQWYIDRWYSWGYQDEECGYYEPALVRFNSYQMGQADAIADRDLLNR